MLLCFFFSPQRASQPAVGCVALARGLGSLSRLQQPGAPPKRWLVGLSKGWELFVAFHRRLRFQLLSKFTKTGLLQVRCMCSCVPYSRRECPPPPISSPLRLRYARTATCLLRARFCGWLVLVRHEAVEVKVDETTSKPQQWGPMLSCCCMKHGVRGK